jgi:4-diphosphocytidyl-2-C-methyl-D-erythritol kinase
MGIGDQLYPLALDLSEYNNCLSNQMFRSVPFRHIKMLFLPNPFFLEHAFFEVPVEMWKDTVVNDFEKSIFPQFPKLKNGRKLLYEWGAIYASMSGSGSAVFGIFRHLPADLENKIPAGVFFSR